MSIRVYYGQLGGHFHLSVFIGPAPNLTHVKAGDLCVRADEFEALRTSWPGAHFLPAKAEEKP